MTAATQKHMQQPTQDSAALPRQPKMASARMHNYGLWISHMGMILISVLLVVMANAAAVPVFGA